MLSLSHTLLLIGSAALAGMINSVAGGGTLLTFPALLAAGQPSTVANATSTVALWPAQLSSLWGYRDEIQQNGRDIVPLVLLGLVGGISGALLLIRTPPSVFDHLMPFLILAATVIFIAQEPLSRWQKARAAKLSPPETTKAVPDSASTHTALRLSPFIALFLLAVSVYGGYFGAGIGILSLAAFGLLGMTNIHQMNGIKAAFTLGINGVASALFVAKALVDWRIAGLMALGSIFGGYVGAGVAKHIGQKNVRRIVIAIGLLLALSLLRKQFFP